MRMGGGMKWGEIWDSLGGWQKIGLSLVATIVILTIVVTVIG
jgi:hypothetical protein